MKRCDYPSGMKQYIDYYGWHFNKKMCQWAVSKMYKETNGKKVYITPYSKDEVEALVKKYNLQLNVDYDAVYIANMAKADFLGSSLQDEAKLILYVKDVMEDSDAYDGVPFTRFYADCIGSGIGIDWEDMI